MDTDKQKKTFAKIREAVTITGLSAYYLRNGCRSGEIPCVRSGSTYYINIPALLNKLSMREG